MNFEFPRQHQAQAPAATSALDGDGWSTNGVCNTRRLSVWPCTQVNEVLLVVLLAKEGNEVLVQFRDRKSGHTENKY